MEFVFNELIYDFRVNNNVNLFKDLLSQDFKKLRFIKRETINKVIIFINIIIKTRYKNKYTLFNYEEDNEVYLYLYYNYKIFKKGNRKLY